MTRCKTFENKILQTHKMYDHQFVFSDISIILYMSMWTKPNTHTKTDGPSNTFYYYYFHHIFVVDAIDLRVHRRA